MKHVTLARALNLLDMLQAQVNVAFFQIDDQLTEAIASFDELYFAALPTPIAETPLSARTKNRLAAIGIATVGELAQNTELELRREPGIGDGTLLEIKDYLGTLGVTLQWSQRIPSLREAFANRAALQETHDAAPAVAEADDKTKLSPPALRKIELLARAVVNAHAYVAELLEANPHWHDDATEDVVADLNAALSVAARVVSKIAGAESEAAPCV